VSDKEPLDFEAEYNNRARVPEYPEIMAGWERDAATYRAARAGRTTLGIAYGPHERQKIDLFHPDEPDAARPLVLFIHGGYWRSLDRSLFSHLAAGANAHGFPVALPGYRLCPEVTLPDIIDDVRAACLFLWQEHGRRMVAAGHSAGGHLAAAMVATDWERLGAPADLVRRGLAISGVFELAPLLSTSINQSLHLDAAVADAVSPAYWPVPEGSSLEAWVGADESSEFLRQSRFVAERWAAAGAATRYVVLPGLNHFTAPDPLADPGSDMTQALRRLCGQCPA
jgi:arylformamidase